MTHPIVQRIILLAAGAGLGLLPTASLAATGQFVRIELSGDNRILTLAEVEVFSGKANVARSGKATQSSVGSGGVASGAIDGTTGGNYTAGKLTHTSTQSNPWWEVDLGKPVSIDQINVYNRGQLQERLEGFTLRILDANRKEVFTKSNIGAPPEAVRIAVKDKGKLLYIGRDGKPGVQPAVLVDVPVGYRDPTPFAFQQDDVVAVIGNGLPDHMQHHGWFEAALQSQLKGKNVRFRNMSQSGDQVDKLPRNKGFTKHAASATG